MLSWLEGYKKGLEFALRLVSTDPQTAPSVIELELQKVEKEIQKIFKEIEEEFFTETQPVIEVKELTWTPEQRRKLEEIGKSLKAHLDRIKLFK